MSRQKREFKMYNLRNPEQSICIVIDNVGKTTNVSPDINDVKEYVEREYMTVSFARRLTEYMDEKNLTSKDIYTRSFIDRKLLHKIISNKAYHPSKKTAFALCVALQLDYQQSVELLGLASYTFAPNNTYDLIFQFVLEEGIYDLDTINEFLYFYHLPCLGE